MEIIKEWKNGIKHSPSNGEVEYSPEELSLAQLGYKEKQKSDKNYIKKIINWG